MSKLIKDKAITDDTWALMESTDTPESAVVADERIIIPLNVWLAQKDALSARKSTLGVWLDSHQLANELGDDAQGFGVIAINFPGFMDGRGFSAATLLRQRYQYQGELRAIGTIIRDQLFFLQRCGFNSYCFAEDIDLEKALASFDDFTEVYQAASDQTLPLFRRRA